MQRHGRRPWCSEKRSRRMGPGGRESWEDAARVSWPWQGGQQAEAPPWADRGGGQRRKPWWARARERSGGVGTRHPGLTAPLLGLRTGWRARRCLFPGAAANRFAPVTRGVKTSLFAL